MIFVCISKEKVWAEKWIYSDTGTFLCQRQMICCLTWRQIKETVYCIWPWKKKRPFISNINKGDKVKKWQIDWKLFLCGQKHEDSSSVWLYCISVCCCLLDATNLMKWSAFYSQHEFNRSWALTYRTLKSGLDFSCIYIQVFASFHVFLLEVAETLCTRHWQETRPV